MALRQSIRVAVMLSILLVVGLVTSAAGYAAGYLAGYDDGFGKRQMSERPAGVPIDWMTPANQARLRQAFPAAASQSDVPTE